MTTDFDLVSAARRVLTDRSDAALSALELAIARRDVAMLMEHNTTLWAECADLKAALDDALRERDDAQRERADYGAAVDFHRDRIAELEQMVGEREGRIGGLEYDVAELTATIDAQRARIAELEGERDELAGRIATLERPPNAKVVMPGRPPSAAPTKRKDVAAAELAGARCRFCGTGPASKQHEQFCPKNPDRILPPRVKARLAAEAAAQTAAPAEQRTPAQQAAATGDHEAAEPAPVVMGARFCQFCRAPFSPRGTALEQHEPRCPENPNRIAPPDLARQITLSVDPSETYTCPDCGGTAFAKALRADRCVNCDNKARIGRVAA